MIVSQLWHLEATVEIRLSQYKSAFAIWTGLLQVAAAAMLAVEEILGLSAGKAWGHLRVAFTGAFL